jgi:hypothetical protein
MLNSTQIKFTNKGGSTNINTASIVYNYCEQSIAKFAIKTRVVIYELVKQLSLIIIADLCY